MGLPGGGFTLCFEADASLLVQLSGHSASPSTALESMRMVDIALHKFLPLQLVTSHHASLTSDDLVIGGQEVLDPDAT